jgi:prevent-host-death family protein
MRPERSPERAPCFPFPPRPSPSRACGQLSNGETKTSCVHGHPIPQIDVKHNRQQTAKMRVGVERLRGHPSAANDIMYILMYTSIMAKSYSVADARAHLPDILDDVEAGKEVELTRRGRAVAVVISAEKYEALRGEQSTFAEAYRAFTTRYALDEIGLDPDAVDSTRDQAPGRRVRL